MVQGSVRSRWTLTAAGDTGEHPSHVYLSPQSVKSFFLFTSCLFPLNRTSQQIKSPDTVCLNLMTQLCQPWYPVCEEERTWLFTSEKKKPKYRPLSKWVGYYTEVSDHKQFLLLTQWSDSLWLIVSISCVLSSLSWWHEGHWRPGHERRAPVFPVWARVGGRQEGQSQPGGVHYNLWQEWDIARHTSTDSPQFNQRSQNCFPWILGIVACFIIFLFSFHRGHDYIPAEDHLFEPEQRLLLGEDRDLHVVWQSAERWEEFLFLFVSSICSESPSETKGDVRGLDH